MNTEEYYINELSNYLLKHKEDLPTNLQLKFNHLPPAARIKIFHDMPIDLFSETLAILLVQAFAEAGDEKTGKVFNNYFYSHRQIEAWTHGALEAILESEGRGWEGKMKNYKKIIQENMSNIYIHDEKHPYFYKILHDYFNEHILIQGRKR